VYVHAPYDVPPQRMHKILLGALVDAPGVMADPKPSIVTNGFDDRGVQYRVRFFIADFGLRSTTEGAVRERIWYALSRHGIDVPAPGRAVRMQKLGKSAASRREQGRLAQQERALGCVDFLARLPEDVRRRLAAAAHTRLYAADEVIIRQSDTGEELFIVESGEVVVTVARPGEAAVEVARLGPGSFFGEMALLTGAPRSATVRAARECEVLVLGKAPFAQMFEASPELAENISQVLARRQAGLTSKLAEHAHEDPPHVVEHSTHLLKRIKEFFSM
jgi:CRP-like cAMP-binding protein